MRLSSRCMAVQNEVACGRLRGGGVRAQETEVTPASPPVLRPPSSPGLSGSRNRLAFGIYCAEAGVVATAAGAWATVSLSGPLRAAVWAGVTAALALGAAWLSRPAVTL